MITLSILLILSITVACYLGYRAYYLAGAVSDAQEYHKGAFEAEDETGTTFQLLLQTITELKDQFNGEASKEK